MKHSENFTTVSQRLGYKNPPKNIRRASGGCIHHSQIWEFEDGNRFFIKQNSKASANVLKAEFETLQEIRNTHTVRCPEPFFFEVYEDIGAMLAMEYLDLQSLGKESARNLGNRLALLHGIHAEQFGFSAPNFIGATPQSNTRSEDWAGFFWRERIHYQIRLASKNGYSFSNVNKLEKAVFRLLSERMPSPSLLHGDLWGGNAAALPDDTPVVFDPASYYGDPETDIAFTEVFGGFPREFYESYCEHADWDRSGYAERKNVYNLYHYLNHLNLFGSGYYGSSAGIIEETIRRYGD